MNSNQELLMGLVIKTLEDARKVCEDCIHNGVIAKTPTEQIAIALGIIAMDGLQAHKQEKNVVPHRN